MLVVSRSTDLQCLLEKLSAEEKLSLDTETFGLAWEDRLFSLIIADKQEEYYFNFNTTPDCTGIAPPEEFILDYHEVFELFQDELFSAKDITWFMHNAKFDMRRLDLQSSYLGGIIHDTEVCERLLQNNRMNYSLETVGEEYGFSKDMTVDAFITKYKLYTQVSVPGKKTKVKLKHFDKVPFELITKYGCRDARITYEIGVRQYDKLLSS